MTVTKSPTSSNTTASTPSPIEASDGTARFAMLAKEFGGE